MATGGVLHVITDGDRRGAQVFGVDLSAALVERSHRSTVVALAPGRVDDSLPVRPLGPTRRHWRTLIALRADIRAAEVVVAHGSSTLPACFLAARDARVPVIYRQISDSLFWANTRAKRLRVRLFLRGMQRVVALWGGSAATLIDDLGVPAAKVRVIPNGVPASRFAGPVCPADRRAARCRLGLDPDRPIAAYVGALVPEKGVDVLVEASGLLPDVQIVVVGEGPDRARLAGLASSRGAGRIVFTGSVADTAEAYAAADLIVLPSRGGDSMPAVLIEAGFCGLPSVATPIGAIPDIVVNGTTGRLAPIGDSAALASGIREVLALRHELGGAARRHCLERFEIGVVAEAWEKVIAEVR